MKVSLKKGIDINKVVTKTVVTVLALYVGGEILIQIGAVMNGTASPFYTGLKLIGWTVGETQTNGTHWAETCGGALSVTSAPGFTTCITDVAGTGVLSVIGIIGIATVVLEFVNVNW